MERGGLHGCEPTQPHGGNGTTEICAYPGTTGWRTKNFNAGASLSWQPPAAIAHEKWWQGLSPAAQWCHAMMAPAPHAPACCAHHCLLLPSAFWDSALSRSSNIFWVKPPPSFWWKFPGSNSPYFPRCAVGWGLQEGFRETQQKSTDWSQLGHEKADSSEMGPAAGKLTTWSYCLSKWKAIHSSNKLMDLIEEIVCHCWQWNINGNISGISWARAAF